MADIWNEYLKRQLPKLGSGSGSMFGSLSSGLQPNKQGMLTPSLLEQMPAIGPPTPINHEAIRNILNSGVLRTGTVPQPQPMPTPTPTPMPAAEPQQQGPSLARLFSLFLGGSR